MNKYTFLNQRKRLFHTTTKFLFSSEESKTFDIDSIRKNDKKKLEGLECLPKVIVIGAGLAGLSAAAQLVKSGINDVTVLEAAERPGGRISSCWIGNTIVELGAQWITGSSISNPITTLASQNGMLNEKSQTKYDYKSGIYLSSDGPVDRLVSTHAYIIFKQIEKQAYALYQMRAPTGHGSLMNFFTVRINQELHHFSKSQRKDAARVMYGLTNKVSNRWGTDLTNLSADLFGTYRRLSGETFGTSQGLIGVLNPLIKLVPEGKILYSKVVDNITWDNNANARAVVKTCDKNIYSADYVIVTVPLGVLKREAEKIFTPSLPEEKLDAIKHLGLGNICKIFLEYEKPFWVSKEGTIKFAWSMDELSKKDSWVKGLNALEELPGSQQILMATISGKYANEVEETSEMKIAKSITYLLRKLTKDLTIPYPRSILMSKWGTSPYFAGTNSYMDINSTKGHRKDYITPVPDPESSVASNEEIPVLFFAGEAACNTYFSSLSGARLTGLKAASQIVQLTKKIGGCPPIKNQTQNVMLENKNACSC